MVNKPRQKGTKGETELVRVFEGQGLVASRMPAGSRYDILIEGVHEEPLRTLAIRPDRGEWLFVFDLAGFLHILDELDVPLPVQVEVKRRATSALHTLWNEEMDW